ncbi:hypothetical protein [Hymenobacter canadensis]|uniref:DUF418 domain-containing protein n=1 Tax=Hymenobacter canadensis TaxID=2999067 RepID=A0ABY7LXL6_9BACT|nr:hypothetical protein [Hymenobacter canadensis]WBA44167.1 hypothetical protein O3303_19975 [Hymenobacter canadensis]
MLLMLAVNVTGDVVAIHFTHGIYGVALACLPTILAGFVFGFSLLQRELPARWAEGRRLLRLSSDPDASASTAPQLAASSPY